MDKQLLAQVLRDQESISIPETIERDILPEVRAQHYAPFAIIITGVRRCGKSTLLHQVRKETGGYFVNFDDERLLNFTVEDFQQLTQTLVEEFGAEETFFFDEIQNVKGWERFVRRLVDEGKKVYLTGSNASMLSRELGTHLTGRHISFTLYPFSFKEYLALTERSTAHKTTEERGLLVKAFKEYVRDGGFPEYLRTKSDEYLKTVYDNIIYRDIIVRYNLGRENAFREVSRYALSNVAKELSFNSLKKLAGLTSATTVKEYLQYLENGYLAFLLNRYDPSLKKQAYYNKKPYAVDTAIARLMGFRPTEDRGRLLENTVFIELLRQGKEAYFHKGNNECDFLVRDGTQITAAIQVTHELSNPERELSGLREAMKDHKLHRGLLLTSDTEGQEGDVDIMPVWKWMLGGN